MANASAFNFTSQIAPPICAVMHTEHDKSNATIFKSLCNCKSSDGHFIQKEALPLVSTRFLRLAYSSPKLARSPARRSHDGREPAGKKSGEMSRAMSAQLPGNGQTVAAAMPPDGRRDDSQYVRATAEQQLASNSWEFRRQLLTMTSKTL
jgi:hypothetical protein